MAIHDVSSQRLYLDAPLGADTRVALSRDQANYLLNVLRMKEGQSVLVFNGSQGEWRGVVEDAGKRSASLRILEQVRAQSSGPDVDYVFAPLKHARLDYIVQKATEMGVRRLRPVFTQRTVPDRVNLDRMRANVIEAAEQCGVLRVPEICSPEPLARILDAWDTSRILIFCDEEAPLGDPITVLRDVPAGPLAVLIGPEGGFSREERARLNEMACTRAISLGPRIMRADTAAVAALALVNAVLGDWR